MYRILSGMAALVIAGPAGADVIYSNLLDTPIPTDFTGTSITIEGGTVNPFFGGVGVANNDLFQPVRTGTGNLATIQNLAVGSTVDVSSIFSTGYGGSQDHLGTTYTAGQEGIIGFKVNGTDYGWMRVVFTGNTSGAVIKDWAYDNSGSAIVVGRVNQSTPSGGTQTVTLSPGSGESFALGSVISNTGGNVNSVVKTGAGTTTLTQANTYTGQTTIGGGKLALGSGGSIDNTHGVTLGGGIFDVSAKTGGYSVSNIGGSGSVLGSLTVTGKLASESSPATTNFQNLTLGNLATYSYKMNGGTGAADLANVSGAAGITNGAVLDLVQLGTYTLGETYTLFGYTNGSLTGLFKDSGNNTLADGSTFSGAGGTWLIDYDNTVAGLNGGTGDRFVTITAVPEISSAFYAAALSLGLLRRRRPTA